MKSVVTDFIIQKNKLGEAITPIYLYAIQYDSVSNLWLYYSSIASDVVFNGVTYSKNAIKHDSIKEDSSGMLGSLSLKIQNVDKVMQYYLQNYGGLKEKKCLISIVWLEALSNSNCVIEHEYYIKSSTAENDMVSLNLGSAIDVLNLIVPKVVFSPTRCQHDEFKGTGCGYSGVTTTCNRTFKACIALGNQAKFGGFPGVPMPFQGILK
jgi:phage-related protein